MYLKKSINILLMLYVTSLIVFTQPTNVVYANLIGVVLAIIYFIYRLLCKNFTIYWTKLLLFYMAFLVITIFSTFWSDNFDLSLEQVSLNIKVFIILFIISNILIELKNIFYVFYGILLGVFVNYLVFFNIYHPSYETWLWVRFMGTTANPNVLAIISIFSIFATIMVIYLGRIKNNIILFILYINIIMSIYMIILSASKKGILFGALLVLGYIFSLVKDKKQFIKLSLGLLIISLFVYFYIDTSLLVDKIDLVSQRFEKLITALSGQGHEQSSEERIRFIKEGFLLGSDTPIFGHGINTFRMYFGLYAHNNYIELFFDLGLIGLFLYYGMYFVILKNVLNIEDAFLKYMILLFSFILLLMDIALVSYYFKLGLIMLITIYEISNTYNLKKLNDISIKK